MSNLNNQDIVAKNYLTEKNLETRINLHKKYDKNLKWAHWNFENYHFFEGCRILELGCGTGSMWEGKIESLPQGTSLTLTDFSKGMIEVVKSKFGNFTNVDFKVMNIQDIEYDDNTFDIVIANSMLYHIPDVAKAISEIYRVLKTDGLFYAFTFGENGQSKFINQKLKEFNPEIDAFGHGTYSFLLQNGYKILSEEFKNIIRYDFIDTLDVTDSSDLVDYILSASAMGNVEKEKTNGLLEFFDSIKDEKGIIKIPREYCMFISQK